MFRRTEERLDRPPIGRLRPLRRLNGIQAACRTLSGCPVLRELLPAVHEAHDQDSRWIAGDETLRYRANALSAARENLAVDEIDAVADRGYYKIEDIADCEAAGITPYVPKPDRSTARRSGHFPKSDFQYDDATDTYRCPAGERLVPLYRRSVGKSRTGTYLVSYANRAPCRGCGLGERCTKNTYRRITRFENEATMERMANRLAARPEVMDRRRESVEHPFGSIKQWMGQGAFLTRRLGNVRGEFSLTALAYNMRRAINLAGNSRFDCRRSGLTG